MNTFGEKLKNLRTLKKLSQQQLADKLNISRATLGHWEIGRSQPNLEQLVNTSNFFGCTIDYLLDSSIPLNPILLKNYYEQNETDKFSQE